MQRRTLIKRAALAVTAFGFSRDLFAFNMYQGFENDDTVIRIGSNENPHGPSQKAIASMRDIVAKSNRYPWDMTTALREKIGASFQLKKENVLIGAGSSELLGLVASKAALSKGAILSPAPSFRLWIPAAERLGAPVQLIPCTTDKAVDLSLLKQSITASTKMIYICNPNNPSGTVLPHDELVSFIKSTPSHITILMDEAYTEYEDTPSVTPMVTEFPNLVVAKTFSKIYGMAGARIGYAIAHEDTIATLGGLQPWANAGAGTTALSGAISSYGDAEFVNYCKKQNLAAKDILYKALDKAKIPFVPSATSFVYFDTTHYAKDFRAMLEAKKIIGARTFEEGTRWLRLSIGTVDEMKQVAAIIKP